LVENFTLLKKLYFPFSIYIQIIRENWLKTDLPRTAAAPLAPAATFDNQTPANQTRKNRATVNIFHLLQLAYSSASIIAKCPCPSHF
jgi:hypothetical protein